MRLIKISALEYLLWLYITACLAWMGARHWELIVPGIFILLLPLVPAGILAVIPGSLGKKVFGKTENFQNPGFRTWHAEMWLGIIVSFMMGWMIVEIKPVTFFTQFTNATGIINGIFSPNTADLVPMLYALIETIYLALMATALAIPFAFFISFFASKNLMSGSWLSKMVYILIRTIATVFRSIEAIVWAIIFCVWVGIGPFAGMLALWVHSIASLIKLYSEQIENIDQGAVEAIKATGAHTLQVWRYAVVPQILAPFLAFTIYRWDINIRMATIVGFVGGGGIGLALYQQQQMLAWRSVGLIMWLIALVVWVMDMISGYIRNKLVT